MRIEFVDPQVIEALRRKTPGERIMMGFEMHRLAQERLRTHLAHKHPEWSAEEVQAEVARRFLRDSV